MLDLAGSTRSVAGVTVAPDTEDPMRFLVVPGHPRIGTATAGPALQLLRFPSGGTLTGGHPPSRHTPRMHRARFRPAVGPLGGRLGPDPDARYPSPLLKYAGLRPTANVALLGLPASGDVLLRLLEADGLWNDRAWGEWLGALSGGIYIPFEIGHYLHRASLISAAVLLANVCTVGFLAFQLWRRRRSDIALP